MDHKKKDKHFIHKPIYEGGNKAIRDFVAQHLQYPESALQNRVEGTVHVAYDIDYKGDVVDARIVGSLGHGCDEEAARVVRLLKFTVLKHRGLKVLFHNRIQIHFRLPKVQPVETTTVQYVYEQTSPKPAEAPESPANGYSYTINF